VIYAVELAPRAMISLFLLAQNEAEFVSFNLFKLAESPRELSLMSEFSIGLLYSFRLAGSVEAGAIWFTVNWQYKREEILYIVSIARSSGLPA
jgi:hypothetical protein